MSREIVTLQRDILNSLGQARFVALPTHLEIWGQPDFEEWVEVGQRLRQIQGGVLWWWGDWLCYGEVAYGEKYSQALEATEYEYTTLAHAAWVSSKIEICRRRQNLSWSHHKEVASLEPQKQDLFLGRAEQEDWTRQELRKAIKEYKKPPALPLPVGVYSVIYTDAPWQYDNSGFDQSAESHYPTMSVEEITALPIAERAGSDTILFLWATSPLLPEALRVMEAWGFAYKASMIWDKGKGPGIGWFVRTEHELLLIDTRENNRHPAVKPGSVIRVAPGRHSAKPSEVYDLIEKMYEGPYLELFARNKRTNWTSWGNEV